MLVRSAIFDVKLEKRISWLQPFSLNGLERQLQAELDVTRST